MTIDMRAWMSAQKRYNTKHTRIETERAGRHVWLYPHKCGANRQRAGREGRTKGATEGIGKGAPGED